MRPARDVLTSMIHDYCEFIDTGDFDAFADLFGHGTWFMTRAEGPGRAPVKRWLDEQILLYDGEPWTKHVTTNLVLEIDEASGAAVARSYVTISQALPDFPLQPIFMGRYRDRFLRHEDEWRWANRDAVADLIGDMSRHMRVPPPPGPARRR